jgi:transcriptional regulator with XRE-family HTH domain
MSSFNRVESTANRIKTAMSMANKKQIDIVKETGIDKGALSSYLKGKYEPKQDVVYKLAKSLDVSEMWLWGYDCPMKKGEIQKKNDIQTDIVVRMRMDKDFSNLIEGINQLNPEQLASVKQIVDVLLKG